ncbi:hypothetical protein [Bradyrhizobium sp. SZCCHNRI1003]|uniref:hypothetical protein n=1 Tax=Bradyrhizobium sp. SZCCHNRI1003 TaxID=3057275 RepID=UPI002916C4DE|nr:hypothetical protein [Bradyrhizobium sp. SZCCHNRI1003]
MEQELIRNLLGVAGAYRLGHAIELSTLGRRAAGDSRFFENLTSGGKTFTVRKYDELMAWFSANWPAGAAWPEGIERPAAADQTAAVDEVSAS